MDYNRLGKVINDEETDVKDKYFEKTFRWRRLYSFERNQEKESEKET